MQKDYRFTLIDRNGTATVIDEPTGWADFTSRITRNPDTHGTINEIQTNSFEFTGDVAAMIRAEYQAYMAQGNMQLAIEARTSTGFQPLYKGQLSFGDTYKSSYNGENGYYCVKIDCDQIGPYVDMANRLDQSVDLTNPKAFDGVTDLAPYPFLNFAITLPSKTIYLQSDATAGDEPYDIFGDTNFAGNVKNAHVNGIIIPKFDKTGKSEITDFTPAYQFDYIDTNTRSLADALEGQQQLSINPASTLVGVNQYNFDINLQGTLTVQYSGDGAGNLKLFVAVRGYNDKREIVAPVLIGEVNAITSTGQPVHTQVININYNFVQSLNLNRSDNFYIYFITDIYHATNTVFTWTSIAPAFNNSTYFKVNSNTKAQPTDSRAWMINEAISRTVEAITNNQLRLYSEYLGRTDSQPFAFPSNGCGANRILTNGKAIRRIIVGDGPNTGVFTSLKAEFEALKATDNVGMGLEGDRVRIEPWTWFYKDDIIMTCKNVRTIAREVQKNEIYKTFKFGYEKWEGEDSNGLDDFFGKREYRLDIAQATSTLEQVCKFIASGYAIEVTRRKGFDSSDWRYDKDIFMICVEPDGTAYKVEINNIINASNIIDPPTIYNFRISPVRNALRWFNRVSGSYRNINTGHRIIFASGDANYQASGQITNASCTLEVAGLAENQDLNLSVFLDQVGAMPIMWPERVTFSYPMGRQQYHNLQANPYGLIGFTSVSENGSGWIAQVDYHASQSMADFSLIPKIQ